MPSSATCPSVTSGHLWPLPIPLPQHTQPKAGGKQHLGVGEENLAGLGLKETFGCPLDCLPPPRGQGNVVFKHSWMGSNRNLEVSDLGLPSTIGEKLASGWRLSLPRGLVWTEIQDGKPTLGRGFGSYHDMPVIGWHSGTSMQRGGEIVEKGDLLPQSLSF